MAGVELILPLGAVATKLRGSSWLFHAWESLELASLNAALVSNVRSSRSGCGGASQMRLAGYALLASWRDRGCVTSVKVEAPPCGGQEKAHLYMVC